MQGAARSPSHFDVALQYDPCRRRSRPTTEPIAPRAHLYCARLNLRPAASPIFGPTFPVSSSYTFPFPYAFTRPRAKRFCGLRCAVMLSKTVPVHVHVPVHADSFPPQSGRDSRERLRERARERGKGRQTLEIRAIHIADPFRIGSSPHFSHFRVTRVRRVL